MQQQWVCALGFFDGVHKGHQQIIEQTCAWASARGLGCAALTFSHHPRTFVAGGAPPILSPLARRVALLRAAGARHVIVLPFDEQVARTAPDDFCTLLQQRYHIVAAVCGENFRFGHRAAGTPDSLRAGGMEVRVCASVCAEDGTLISSTAVRKLIEQGNLARAAQYLGQPMAVDGQVCAGRVTLAAEQLLPPPGRYAVRVDGLECVAVLEERGVYLPQQVRRADGVHVTVQLLARVE